MATEVELERGFSEIAGLIGGFGTDGMPTTAIRTETLRLDALYTTSTSFTLTHNPQNIPPKLHTLQLNLDGTELIMILVSFRYSARKVGLGRNVIEAIGEIGRRVSASS